MKVAILYDLNLEHEQTVSDIARLKGISMSTLIDQWITERIEAECYNQSKINLDSGPLLDRVKTVQMACVELLQAPIGWLNANSGKTRQIAMFRNFSVYACVNIVPQATNQIIQQAHGYKNEASVPYALNLMKNTMQMEPYYHVKWKQLLSKLNINENTNTTH